MTNLEYYLHDEADALRIEIVGNLSGAGVGSIEHAWRPQIRCWQAATLSLA